MKTMFTAIVALAFIAGTVSLGLAADEKKANP